MDSVPRERYASLDQLAPGDRISWTADGQHAIRELYAAAPEDGDWWHLDWEDGGCDYVNAALLVRRAER